MPREARKELQRREKTPLGTSAIPRLYRDIVRCALGLLQPCLQKFGTVCPHSRDRAGLRLPQMPACAAPTLIYILMLFHPASPQLECMYHVTGVL